MKTYIDPYSKKPITYTEGSVFGIFTKVKSGRKYARRFFGSAHIEQAVKEFYDLDIPLSHRKHLIMFPSKHLMSPKDGTLILSMQGYLPNVREYQLDVKTPKNTYKKVATLNLINTPEAIAIKLRALNFSEFPLVSEKWTQTKVMYCLLSYFLSLNQEDKNKLMKEAFYCYLKDKLASSGREQDIAYVTEVTAKINQLPDDYL